METGQKRKIFIQETLPDMDLMQEDLSSMCLIGSKIRSFKLQEGRCRYLRAQDTRLQDFSIDNVLCDKGYYQNCHWNNLQVRDSFLTASHFSGCKFEKTVGKLSSFGLSTFYDCKLHGSRLSEVSLVVHGGMTAGLSRRITFLSVSHPQSLLILSLWDAVCKRLSSGQQPLFGVVLRVVRSTMRYFIRPG
jgi:hypothetical protein